jgi:DNA-binding CsgD family transcriptional regulator
VKWSEETEKQLVELREKNLTMKQIADILGTTVGSVKHKCVRLNQKNNADSHHHPVEKQQQIKGVLDGMVGDITVLETHAGYGNLTNLYSSYAKKVVSYEIDKCKCEHINQQGYSNVECHNKDSLKELYLLIYNNVKFNIIDVDPYGFPSRYFPNIFELIDDGYMFVTIPKYGCAQINNITKLHIKSFYGFEGGNNEHFLYCCL